MLFRTVTGALCVAGFATVAAAQTKWDMPTPDAAGNFHTRSG